MNRHRASSIERRRAAASIAWPEGTLILTNPDPAAQRTLKGVAIALAAAACLFAVTGTNGPMQQWGRSRDYLEMRPAMESAMRDGNRSAGTWLAVHFSRDYPGLLQTEADAGEPTAMYLIARMRLQQHASAPSTVGHALAGVDPDRESGMQLMRRAAAAGNQDALRYVPTQSDK
ncbi:hypothetical protein [Burkholderia metallica]|uniref:hypothetical protein n=1 Tax=Burkholderia metallica TaxID=488729 RepID=UPI00158EA4CC|nr:hypothetical protein [Burkholderia metallica]